MIYYTQRFLLVSLLLLIGLSASNAQAKKFTLQVEAMDNLTPALKLIQQLKSSGVDAYYVKSEVPGKGLFYRVRVGNFTDPTTAQQKGDQLRRAQLIKDYYVARYEGSNYRPISNPIALSPNRTSLRKPAVNPNVAPELEEDDDAAETEDEAVADGTPQKKPAPVRRAPARRPVRIIRQGPVETGVGNVRIRVPFEQDDIGEGCFVMSTGSSVTSLNSFGVFTTRDQVMGAIIPYAGTESKLKFKADLEQGWTPPRGVIAADVIKMRVNPAGYREFHAVEQPVRPTSTLNTGGKIMFAALSPGEYMIRGRLGNGKCVFLPVSVRQDCCTADVK